MYDLPYFKEEDQNVLIGFIQQFPFAFISGVDDQQCPVATQIPVFIEQRGEKFYLTGHIMRQTDHHKAFEKNPNVLVVFTGPHCYVSASWYNNPYQGSTWNYMSVQASGKISFGDEQSLIKVLRQTTLHFEKENHESPTVFDNLPSEYTERLMKAIVAFEIEVTEFRHVFKLSQNRDEGSYDNIISKLELGNHDEQEIARIMKERKNKVYPA